MNAIDPFIMPEMSVTGNDPHVAMFSAVANSPALHAGHHAAKLLHTGLQNMSNGFAPALRLPIKPVGRIAYPAHVHRAVKAVAVKDGITIPTDPQFILIQ